MFKTIYTKVSNDRDCRFGVVTCIKSDGEKRIVVKTPAYSQSVEHVQNFVKIYDLLSKKYENTCVCFAKAENKKDNDDGSVLVEYVTGSSFSSYLDELLKKDDKESFMEEISRYFDNLLIEKHEFKTTDAFVSVFGNVSGMEGVSAVSLADIDALFDNVIYNEGTWMDYDYEWTFDFPIPVEFIIYRIIKYYLIRSKARTEIGNMLFDEYSIDASKKEIFEQMEVSFQEYVQGDRTPMYRLYGDIHGECKNLAAIEDNLKLKDDHIGNIEASNKNLEEAIKLKDGHIANIEALNKRMEEAIKLKDNHISNIEVSNKNLEKLNKNFEKKNSQLSEDLEARTRQVERLHRGIRNPVYGCYLVARKIRHKFFDLKKKKYDKKYKWLRDTGGNCEYEVWMQSLEREYDTMQTFSYNPLISIVVPVYNVLDRHLTACIESVINQTYTNWELCLADDCSTWDNVRKTLKKYENNPKIKIVYRKENGHISKCTNSAIAVAQGEFVGFLDCDDTLADNALYEVVKALNENENVDYVYSDEDKVDDDGKNRHMPHFKPDWSPDTLLSHMYTCHFSVYRKSIVDELGGLRAGYEGAQDYDFTLRFTEKTDKIVHIPKILYHWRERKESTSASEEAKPYVIDATRKSKEDALARRGIQADVEQIAGTPWFRIIYKISGNPKVSIVIPSKDNYAVLKRCVDSIYKLTAYKNYEIILIDNGSNDENREQYDSLANFYGFKYIYRKMEFNFSKMCNDGAKEACGEYYLFLNDDTEIIMADWLELMLGQAQQEQSGAVGAKLIYPDTDNIQHAGVINIKSGPAHAFTGLDDSVNYYFARNRMEYNYCAVTAACLMIAKKKFEEIGGFEEGLAVAYNDVDLCFKLVEHGYYNLVRTDVRLLHYESISRGNDLVDDAKVKRLQNEQRMLYKRHPLFASYDPFYNINLAQDRTDFSYNYNKIGYKFNNVKEVKQEFRASDKVLGNLDIVRVSSAIYIEGWGFIQGYKRNNDINVKLLLQSDKNCYLVETNKKYRPDLTANFGIRNNIEYTGFFCEIENSAIEEGKYTLSIICRNKKLVTDKMITV